jgi:SAM-dependent methyltransferase
MNETEAWLVEWHARFPGVTARHCAHAQPSTYEWLAERAHPGDRVLDLACGDGYLLELVRARGVARAAGLDLSPAELAAARTRLGDGVELVEGRAQALPFTDGSFDCVTSHLALMLMSPIEPVMAEIHRVLRPGGRLAAIVGASRPAPRRDAWQALVGLCVQVPLEGPPLGDPRAGDVDELRALLSGFEDVRIQPMLLDLSGPPKAVWSLLEHTYLPAMVPADDREAFDRDARALVESMAGPDGKVPCALDLLAVEAARGA